MCGSHSATLGAPPPKPVDNGEIVTYMPIFGSSLNEVSTQRLTML